MTKTQRNRLKLALTGFCFTWAAVTGWVLILGTPEEDLLHHKSPAVKALTEQCEGTFQQRYDCKQAILIQAQRETFNTMTGRLIIVVVPAVVLGLGGSLVIRRIPLDRPAPPPESHADLDWKARAQRHVSRSAGDQDDQSPGLS